MFKVGALAGKFLPPQIGHVKLIKEAAAVCETLYVVLAENPEKSAARLREVGMQPISYRLRLKWLRRHFKNQKNIRFLFLNEKGLPEFPDGTKEWSEKFKKLIGKKIDAKFIGEERYREMNDKFFPESKVVIVRRGIDSPDVSASKIRNNLKENIKYTIPECRKYFEKILKAKEKK